MKYRLFPPIEDPFKHREIRACDLSQGEDVTVCSVIEGGYEGHEVEVMDRVEADH